MIEAGSTVREASAASPQAVEPLRRIQSLAASIKRRWQDGEPADAAIAIQDHPELLQYRSIALELARSEYRLRQDCGTSVDLDAFCRRFPDLHRSLFLLIKVHSLLDADPDIRALEDLVRWPKPGESFLGYELESELGRGTFGRVYLARQPALGNRRVAVKISISGGDEADTLGRLRHSNIVPVFSVEWDDATGLATFCMPFLGRATLSNVLDADLWASKPPRQAIAILDAVRRANAGLKTDPAASPSRILRRGSYEEGVIELAAQIAEGLAHCHRCGIFHRDLKPSNVLLSAAGAPLLLDFNLSTVDRSLDRPVGGTLPYMPPEMLARLGDQEGELADIDGRRADLFSLGVILYELLTRELPFGAMPGDLSPRETARWLVDRQAAGLEPILHKNPRVEKRLAGLIARCIAFNPEDRPEHADAVASELRRSIAPIARAKRWLCRHRSLSATAAATASLLAALVATLLVLRPPHHERQYQMGMSFYANGNYEAAAEHFSEALRDAPKSPPALIARSAAQAKLGDYRGAVEDLGAAARIVKSPKLDACLGYCMNRIKHHDAALALYDRATDSGLRSAAVLNNRGFALRQMGRLDEARQCLLEAVAEDENLQHAHNNLILVELNRSQQGKAISEDILPRVRQTLSRQPACAELHRQAATLLALAAQREPNHTEEAAKYLDRAVDLGLDPKRLQTEPAFSKFANQPAFAAIWARSPGGGPSSQTEYLVDLFDEFGAALLAEVEWSGATPGEN